MLGLALSFCYCSDLFSILIYRNSLENSCQYFFINTFFIECFELFFICEYFFSKNPHCTPRNQLASVRAILRPGATLPPFNQTSNCISFEVKTLTQYCVLLYCANVTIVILLIYPQRNGVSFDFQIQKHSQTLQPMNFLLITLSKASL